MSEKKQIKTLVKILGKMDIEVDEDISIEKAKRKFEKAIEAGKSPEGLGSEDIVVLKELGYEIDEEEAPKKKKDEEEEEEEKPAKKSKKKDEEQEGKGAKKDKGYTTWFKQYFKTHRKVLRSDVKEAWKEEFGDDEAAENALHSMIWRARTQSNLLGGRRIVESKVLTVIKDEVLEAAPEEEEKPAKRTPKEAPKEEEEKPSKKSSRKDAEEE